MERKKERNINEITREIGNEVRKKEYVERKKERNVSEIPKEIMK